jgi:small subunit ribosomal protein S17
MVKTITIKRNYNFYVKKFQRYERRNTKQSAHVPECMEVEIGDVVRIMETRPLSKTISFVVIEIMKQEGVK